MNTQLIAALCAALSTLPFVLGRKYGAAIVYLIVAFVIEGALLYMVAPSTIWPLFGMPGFLVFVAWLIGGIINAATKGGGWGLVPAILALCGYIVTGFAGWSAFNASTYATMIGQVEEREWTADVQPKDPRHMRMVSDSTALYIAQKAVANAGAIGSQFELDAAHMTLQRVKGQLEYVIPFDFSGFSKWTNSAGVPAYIIVDAEDPERQPQLVQLDSKSLMNYMPGAYFSYNLTRHLRNNGFVNDGLVQARFELDDEGNPHWVITTYKPVAQWWGEQVTGVATVDPATGAINRYAVADAPAWIDRIYPEEFVNEYAEWWGLYSGGWLNSWWGQKDLTTTEEPSLIYGEGDKAEWVIGITSTGANDDSLIELLYTDSRTGKSVLYKTDGGATDTAILNAVNNNQYVKYKQLTGTTPQIYNVDGTMAAIVPLIAPNTAAYQGVAFVPIKNPQEVAVGATQSEALRGYEALIYKQGQQVAVTAQHDVKELTGIVDRIREDIGATGSVYLFHIDGAPRIFSASSGEYIKLGVTQPGDTVHVTYVASGEDVVPVQAFDNLSLPLDKTQQQTEVQNAAAAKQQTEANRTTAKDLVSRIQNMTPDQLQKLQDALKSTTN